MMKTNQNPGFEIVTNTGNDIQNKCSTNFTNTNYKKLVL